MAAIAYSNKNINRFYLQMMGDNALILYNAFSPQEKEISPQIKAIADRFDALVQRASQNTDAMQTTQINREAQKATIEFRKTLLDVMKLILTSRFHIDLKTIILNYFIDEADRYLELLNDFMNNNTPAFELLPEEIFWLSIFSIQSRYIADNLGYFQEQTRTYAQHLAQYLTNYGEFSEELLGLTRTGASDFPMLKQHHIATMELLNTYYNFLNNIIDQVQQKKIQGSISLLYVDRSKRTLCFFLKNAAAVLGTTAPVCDPFSKRLSVY